MYDTFAEFEIAVLVTALRGTERPLLTVGLTRDPVTTTGGLRVLPDMAIEDVDPTQVAALVIPGGNAEHAVGNPALRALVHQLDAKSALLAAICGGPAVLGDAGVLDDRHYTAALDPSDVAYAAIVGRGHREAELVVTDEHVVTAVGSAYLSFAEAVLQRLDRADGAEPLSYFRQPSLA